jgi:hypothetical protein
MKISVEIILIIIIGIIILFNSCYETEHFYNVTGTTIAGADIDAIRNLNSYAKTLMKPDGTLTNPGNLNVAGDISSKNISRTDGGDWLRINDATNNAGRTALYGNLSINSTQKGFGGLNVGTWGSDAGEGNIKATGNITMGSVLGSNDTLHIHPAKNLYLIPRGGSVLISKDWGASGNLTVVGNQSIGGDLTVGGQLKVDGDLRIKGKIIFDTGDGKTSEILGGDGNIVFTKNNNMATRHGFYMSIARDNN